MTAAENRRLVREGQTKAPRTKTWERVLRVSGSVRQREGFTSCNVCRRPDPYCLIAQVLSPARLDILHMPCYVVRASKGRGF